MRISAKKAKKNQETKKSFDFEYHRPCRFLPACQSLWHRALYKLSQMKKKIVIIILGPTAVGKTASAIELAQYINTSIISADSRQCFRELNIGVAKPFPPQLLIVPHYFISSHSIAEEVNASLFEKLALEWAEKIFKDHDELIMVGGTGLYIKAFCEGLDDMPPVSPEIRKEVLLGYETNGMSWLQEQVKENDPVFFERGERLNPQRLMRALEIKLATGRSILSFRTRTQKERNFEIMKIGLQLPKDQMKHNIYARVEAMMNVGLLDEVKKLFPFRHLNALRTVGYTELFDHLDGKISLDQAIELIKKNTVQYAKRQLTWFRKDHTVHWLHPEELMQDDRWRSLRNRR